MHAVSVIIPTFNRASFLRRAIQSVLNQTFQDFEIIVLDDGSSDNTKKVIESFDDRRIKYIRHDRNLGEAKARNECLRQCNGEYVAFLDDDDEWQPEKLEKQLSLFTKDNPGIGLVYCGYYSVKVDGTVMGVKTPELRGSLNGRLLARNIVGPTSAALIKRSTLDVVGNFDEEIVYGMDQDLWIRISRIADIEVVPDPLVKRTIHPNRLSDNPVVLLGGFNSMLKKYPVELKKNKEFCYRKYLSIGMLFCRQGDIQKGRKILLSAISTSPLQLRPYLFVGLSLFGRAGFNSYTKVKNWVKS